MAASDKDRILLVIAQWNDEGREICQKDLADMNIVSVPTLNKYITEMIEDGIIRAEHEQTDHGTRKNLYIAEMPPRDAYMKRLLFELGRIADALEGMSDDPGRTGIRRKPTDGRWRQQRLNP
jgi:DNA-binding Lrp family transcriptional regulator